MPHSVTYATVLVVRDDIVVHRWSLDGYGRPDARVVDALARAQLVAHRFGWAIRLRDISADLAGLLDLCGLSRTFCDATLCVEVGRKTERREEVGVEEVVETDDPVA